MSVAIAYGANTLAECSYMTSMTAGQYGPMERVFQTKGWFCRDNFVLTSDLCLLDGEHPDHGTTATVTGSISGISHSGTSLNYTPMAYGQVGSLMWLIKFNDGVIGTHAATYIDLEDSSDTEHTLTPLVLGGKYTLCVPLISKALVTHKHRFTITDGTGTLYITDSVPRYIQVMMNRIKSMGYEESERKSSVTMLSAVYRFWQLDD